MANFPVLVRLANNSPSGFNYADCAADGSDIRFADSGGNSIPHDFDTWNTNGESLVWVRLPTMVQGTQFTIHYGGNPTSVNTPSDVWAGYLGVWHMNSTSPADASGSGNNGTASGSVALADGKVGSGLSYPTSTATVSCGSSLAESELSGGYTIAGWVNLADISTARKALFGKSGFISYRMEDGTSVMITTPAVKDYDKVTNFITAANEWHYFTLTFALNTTGGAKHYMDGVLKATQDTGGTKNVTGSTEMWIGDNQYRKEGSIQGFIGLLDEYRLSASVRSADWINAEYSTMANSGFLVGGQVASGDKLTVHSTPVGYGVPSHLGITSGLVAGQTVEVSCGVTPWTNVAETITCVCTGWRLYNDDDNVVSNGTETSFTYTHPTPAENRRLEWLWEENSYKGTIVAASGGTVSPSGSAWYSATTPLAVTATPEVGNAFAGWVGASLPEGISSASASVTFTPTAPFDMTATFMQPFDYYVAKTGNDGAEGTQGAPLLTIGRAIEMANAAIGQSGDGSCATIHVAPGTYEEDSLTIANPITIVGDGGNRDAVIVDANSSSSKKVRAFLLNHPKATISSLTVINGGWLGGTGGNILIESAGGIVTNCVVANGVITLDYSIGTHGGNIFMDSDAALVVDCVVTNGSAASTPGVGGNIAARKGRISRCVIRDGKANQGGGGGPDGGAGNVFLYGTAVMENCLVTGGTLNASSGQGTGVNINSTTAKLINCTIVGNYPKSGTTQAAVWLNAAATVVNCVIYGNGGTKATEWGNKNAACFYNCAFSADAEFSGGTSCVTDLTDAAFKDYAKGDYRPVAAGVLFNAGDNAAYTNNGAISATDLAGAARIVKKVIDIGCYETATSAGLQIVVR